MIGMTLNAAAEALRGRGIPAELLQTELLGGECRFAGLAIDSRDRQTGVLFVALKGERFDAHDFAAQAVDNGAVALLVERPLNIAVPQLRVADARLALGALAAAWRRRRAATVIGITGSNGKTTNKELVAAILAQDGPTLATQGNLNNDIGVPLTLARLSEDDRYAVIEMGANHPGEIAYLAGLAAPQIALLSNAGPAHLEGFGSLQGVADAKGEIYDALPEHGVAIVNADDAFAASWRARIAACGERRVLSFGLHASADFSATWQALPTGCRMHLRSPLGDTVVDLPLHGEHNVMNALGAAAAAVAAGANLDQVRAGLAGVARVGGRMVVRAGRNGARVIDDTYNANPGSFRAAIAVLAADTTARGEPAWLVMGDMGELGPESAALHAQVGEWAREQGVAALYAFGPLSAHAARAFGAGARHFDDIDALIAALLKGLAPNRLVLVKGSRAMRMERVVRELVLDGHDNNKTGRTPATLEG